MNEGARTGARVVRKRAASSVHAGLQKVPGFEDGCTTFSWCHQHQSHARAPTLPFLPYDRVFLNRERRLQHQNVQEPSSNSTDAKRTLPLIPGTSFVDIFLIS